MPLTPNRGQIEVASHLLRERLRRATGRCVRRFSPERRPEAGLARRRIDRGEQGNRQRLHVHRPGTKLPKPVCDQRFVRWQQERGGEDQVRCSSSERREHGMRGVPDDELSANQFADDARDLHGLVRVGFDGSDEGAGYVRNIHIVSTIATATNVHI